MARYTLFGFNASTYVRTIRMLLLEKGIDYEQVPVNILQGEGQAPEHKQRHPFGKIPALAADSVQLFETDAIAELIEGQHPAQPSFIPDDVVARATMRQWMGCIDDYTYPDIVGTLVWQKVVNPILGQATDEQAVQDALPRIRYHFELFDKQLGQTPYLAGDAITLADLYLAPIMAYVAMTPEGSELIPAHGNVARWWEQIQRRPSFQQTPPR